MSTKDLVLGNEFGGLGDHLFLSCIPELFKRMHPDKKIYISTRSKFRSWEIYDFVWKNNPFIDGVIDKEIDPRINTNLLIRNDHDIIENFLINLSIKYKKSEAKPKIYLKDNFIFPLKKNQDYEIIDLNYLSYIGAIDRNNLRNILQENITSSTIIVNPKGWIINEYPQLNKLFPKSLYEYINYLNFARRITTLASGGAPLAISLGKKARVYYGYRCNPIFLLKENENIQITQKSLYNFLVSEYYQSKNLLKYDKNNNVTKEKPKLILFFYILFMMAKKSLKIKKIFN